MKRIQPEHLWHLRTDLDVTAVMGTLKIPLSRRGKRLAFRCPACALSHTAILVGRNLAYCFPCRRRFNTIDIVMAERRCTFLEAVEILERVQC